MRTGQHATLSAVLAIAIASVLAGLLAQRFAPIQPAQAQSDAEKRKKEQERQKAAPPKAQPPPPKGPQTAPPKVTTPPPPPPKGWQTPPPKVTAPPPPPPKGLQAPPPSVTAPPLPGVPLQKQPSEKPAAKPPLQPPPPAAKSAPPGPPPGFEQKEGIKRPPPPPGPSATPPPPKTLPPAVEKAVPPVAKPPAPGPGGPVAKRFEDVQKGRRERTEDGGRRKVIEEPGKRFIVKQDNKAIIRHDEAERFLRRPGARSERRPDGNVETFYVRSDGVRIITVVDANGRLLRRFRRDREGRERNIIDNRRFYGLGAVVGIGAIGIIALNLPPPRITIPRDRYIVVYEDASDDDLDEALMAPPLEPLERAYSLDEIRYNYELRARMRRIDLDTIIFDFGSWEVPPDQYDRLERVARAIHRVLRDNPEAVFLIEAYTDAVGSEEDNLSLSDRRAQAVAEILAETFDVPPENLVTQGYGEQYLKIPTQGPEPRNRIVIIRNITELMAER
jgi:outer membrane protein OmpA-like peptidoglycan-associated protein